MRIQTFFSGAIALGVTAALIPLAAASAGTSPASPGISGHPDIGLSNVPRARPAGHLPAPGTRLAPAIAASPGTWSFVGPQPVANDVNSPSNYGNVSGRVTSIAVDPAVSGTAYAGSAGGGVWKTTDGGAHWTPTTDSQMTGAIGAVATAPGGTGQPSVVYAGTGEDNLCGDCQIGFGVLKSTNGGTSWSLLGLATFTATRALKRSSDARGVASPCG